MCAYTRAVSERSCGWSRNRSRRSHSNLVISFVLVSAYIRAVASTFWAAYIQTNKRISINGLNSKAESMRLLLAENHCAGLLRTLYTEVVLAQKGALLLSFTSARLGHRWSGRAWRWRRRSRRWDSLEVLLYLALDHRGRVVRAQPR